jgi:hypothetical protein
VPGLLGGAMVEISPLLRIYLVADLEIDFGAFPDNEKTFGKSYNFFGNFCLPVANGACWHYLKNSLPD